MSSDFDRFGKGNIGNFANSPNSRNTSKLGNSIPELEGEVHKPEAQKAAKELAENRLYKPIRITEDDIALLHTNSQSLFKALVRRVGATRFAGRLKVAVTKALYEEGAGAQKIKAAKAKMANLETVVSELMKVPGEPCRPEAYKLLQESLSTLGSSRRRNSDVVGLALMNDFERSRTIVDRYESITDEAGELRSLTSGSREVVAVAFNAALKSVFSEYYSRKNDLPRIGVNRHVFDYDLYKFSKVLYESFLDGNLESSIANLKRARARFLKIMYETPREKRKSEHRSGIDSDYYPIPYVPLVIHYVIKRYFDGAFTNRGDEFISELMETWKSA